MWKLGYLVLKKQHSTYSVNPCLPESRLKTLQRPVHWWYLSSPPIQNTILTQTYPEYIIVMCSSRKYWYLSMPTHLELARKLHTFFLNLVFWIPDPQVIPIPSVVEYGYFLELHNSTFFFRGRGLYFSLMSTITYIYWHPSVWRAQWQ